MDLTQAVKGRRSIRRFKTEKVPQDLVRAILDDARWAPSWGNTQVWEFFVAMGDTLEKFRKGNRDRIIAEEKSVPEIPMPETWPEKPNRRYTEIVKGLLDALTIARADKGARNQVYADMYALFDAPCLLVTCMDRRVSLEYAMYDLGLVMQTICLLAHERGLGTCMLAAAVRYPDLVREVLSIPDSKRIVIGTALGYPDWESSANKFERQRAPLDELVTWVR